MKEAKKAMASNSPLINYVKISPNKTVNRNHAIDTITIHCMAGQLSVESCGNVFASPSRCASSNYGVGPDGRIGLYVEEKDRSWCSSNGANDNRAITIEVASDSKPPYAVKPAAYNALINLLVDICKRNRIKKLLWQGNKALIGQVDKQNMTVHRWFASKACPGDYLYNKHGEIAAAVNAKLDPESSQPVVDPVTPVQPATPVETSDSKIVQIIVDLLNVRTGPGVNYAQVATVKRGEKFTIVATSNGWGKLKSGAGWISLNSKYVKVISDVPAPATPAPSVPSLPVYAVKKVYTLQTELNVRTGPGTNYGKKTYNQLSADAKKNDKNKNGALDKGTKVTCLETKVVGTNEVWMRCPSGWIAAYYKGNQYVK